jgi:type VI secretion system protein ImpI
VTHVFVLSAFELTGAAIGEPKRLSALPIRIGRNGLNDFVLNHVVVSSFHARIEDVEGRLCVTDLNSKNGVWLRSGRQLPSQIQPNMPVDLQPSGFEFYFGAHVVVRLTFERAEDQDPRSVQRFTGHIVGNPSAMGTPSPGAMPGVAMPVMRAPASPPPPVGPSGMPPALGQIPAPALGGFQVAQSFPGVEPAPLPGGPGHERTATAALPTLSAETMALLGLKELMGSLVPGVALESTGDIARFITKLHDTLEAFCRSFVPLREGHAQFMSSLDLQRALRRSQQRSPAYLAVEGARTPEALAAALLNPKDRFLDGPQAVEGILADLMLHQLALLEGVMRGVRALLEELSPANIEAQAGGGPLSLGRHRALWSRYCEVFEGLAEERQAFSVIFGPEFTAAYRQYRAGAGQRDQ